MWWKQLHEILNSEETLQAISKEITDEDDQNMREGLGILELLAMEEIGDFEGTWSPILQMIASSEVVSSEIATFLLSSIGKKDLQEEV